LGPEIFVSSSSNSWAWPIGHPNMGIKIIFF
jgi:hypothetical protein